MPTRHVTFQGSGGVELSGRLELPNDGSPAATAVFAHCFTCGKDAKAAVHVSRRLCREGVATLRFDFAGIGASGGDLADTSFASTVDDLVAAARYVRGEIAPAALLVGHSLGGAAALLAAARLSEIRAVATIAAPSDPAHAARLFAGVRDRLDRTGEATVRLGGRPQRVTSALVNDLERHPLTEAVSTLGRPILLLHSPVDRVVGIDHAARLYAVARHPKSFVALPGADHLLLGREDAEYAGRVIAAWASRYLSHAPPELTPTADTPPPRSSGC